MAFKIPTIKEIATRIQTDIRSEIKTGTALKRSFVAALSYAIAAVVYLLHKHLEYVIDQILPSSRMAFDFLAKFASLYNVRRKAATKSQRTVEATGSAGAYLPVNAVLIDDEGHEFIPTGEFQVLEGVVTATIIAADFGVDYNIPVDSKLALQSPVPGINSEFTVLEDDLIDGVNEESHESLLERLLEVIRNTSNGGNKTDYEIWAKEVPGVTRAWCYPLRFGIGTVGVAFVTDDAEDIIPTEGKVDEVQDYIDEVKPVPSRVTVFAPVKSEVDFTIAIIPNTEEIRNAVTNALKDLFAKESVPEGRLLISHIREAISTSLGEDDHEVVEPSEDIVAVDGQLKVLGDITFENVVYE